VDTLESDQRKVQRCRSCEASLDQSDRYCPACGNPNIDGPRHPRFGPAPVEPVGAPDRPTAPPVGVPFCPLCWAIADLRQPFCGACGMSLDSTRRKALVDGYFGTWGDPDGVGSRWRNPGRLSAAVRGSLVLVTIVALAVVAAAVVQLSGTPISMSTVRLDESIYTSWGGRLGVMILAGSVVAALLVVLWTRRAYRNLAALGVSGLRLRTGWATASWFIPFVNLVLPKEVIDDLWRASDPDTPPLTPTWRLRTVPFWIHIWWISILGSGVMLCTAQWLPGDASTSTYDHVQASVLIVAHLALAFSCVLTMILIGDVNGRQQERIDKLFHPKLPLEVLESDESDGCEVVALLPHEPATVASVAGRY
jgi:hypothetical protein